MGSLRFIGAIGVVLAWVIHRTTMPGRRLFELLIAIPYPLGPLVGALILIGLEEALKGLTEHWRLIEGIIVIGLVIAMPSGARRLLDMVFGPSERPAEPKPAGEARHG